MKYKLQIYV